MIDFKVALRTTVMLVDDDTSHLELRTRAMKMAGFSVINATSPQEAISLMNAGSLRKIDVAVIDYHMPVMNGCVLAEYLKTRYGDLKIVLYSGALNIPEDELSNVDMVVPKSAGVAALIAKVTEVGQIDAANTSPANPSIFAFDDQSSVETAN